MADFIPRQEGMLAIWANAFAHTIQQSPGRYGLTTEQSDTLQTFVQAFLQARAVTSAAGTRTQSAIVERNLLRDEMLVEIRRLVGIVRRAVGVGADKQVELGLKPIRSKSRIGAPTSFPTVQAAPIDNRTLRVMLHDSETSRRSKPAGVSGAAIFIHLGDYAPAKIRDWTFYGNTTRAIFPLTVRGPVEHGQQVWICAQWLSTRNLPGKLSTPVAARIIGGLEPMRELGSLAA